MHYIGKDILTSGSLLHLNKKIAWEQLRSRAKQGIRKAQRAGIRCVPSRNLALMRQVWYNPDTLCSTLEPEQTMYLAYVGDQLCGGIIVTPVTANTLFYHYGGTNELGRSIEANSYLFWHVVEQFEQSKFTYLDVGVSFRPALQHYFQKYCTQAYPIIFRAPPESARPRITLNPFTTGDLNLNEQHVVAINTRLFEYFDAEFTYMPAWEFALQSAFRACSAEISATVGVWCSVGTESYLQLLTELFGDRWTFVREDKHADILLVAHRWGKLDQRIEQLALADKPLIEDCRDLLLGSGPAAGGHAGRYAVFDFARAFPVQYGAALAGEYFSDQHIWNHFHCLDVTKRNALREGLQVHWPLRERYANQRLLHWRALANHFDRIGMSYLPLNGEFPTAFVLKGEGPYSAEAMQTRLAEFGVNCEADTKENLIAIPCHQQLSLRHIDYIFGAFRGMVNPCYTYVRQDPDEEHK